MKNSLLRLLLLVITSFNIISCDNNDTEALKNVQENPLKEYLNNSGFDQVTYQFINSGYYEFGFRFIPKTDGTIKKIIVKTPDNQTNLRVTIWDVVTKIIYRTEIISSVLAATETSKTISPLSLLQDKEYMITYAADDWYYHRRSDSSDAMYPILAGNILITGYNFMNIQPQTQLYPTSTELNGYAGDISFVFQPN